MYRIAIFQENNNRMQWNKSSPASLNNNMLQNFNDNPFLFLADLRHAVKRLIALKFGHSRSTVHHLRLIRINFRTLMSIIFSSFQRQKTWEEMCGIYISKNEIDGTGEEKGN